MTTVFLDMKYQFFAFCHNFLLAVGVKGSFFGISKMSLNFLMTFSVCTNPLIQLVCLVVIY